MPHMMDNFPLQMSVLYNRAVRLYQDQEIVSVEHDLSIRRASYGATDERIRRLSRSLSTRLRIEPGGVFGTFARNNVRHHELYWAAANTGRVCHTLNIRLFPEQLVYIINHARDEVLFVDPDLVPVVAQIASRLETVHTFVVMGNPSGEPDLPNVISYEDLIADMDPIVTWPTLDERSPMMLCYTSGTTGNPKGVAYTQRSTYLHTISNLANFPIMASDNVLAVVPMFHAAAWGYPFMATVQGAKITYPGPDLSPPGLLRLFEQERVTFSAGVPTVWLGIQQHIDSNPGPYALSLRALLGGGSAVPRSLIDWFWKNLGVLMLQGWGMTETNPVAAVSILKPEMEGSDWELKLDRLETAGLPVPGLEVRILDEKGHDLPWDGEAFGELLIRGPWIAAEYYKDSSSAHSFQNGWLRTGDVCKITPDGYIKITDRAKDLIKSGGEWISSLDLENALMAHEGVAEATVVGVAHPKWQERPVAFVVPRDGTRVSEPDLLQFLSRRVAEWWLPDRIIFIDEIPKTGTGKFDKKVVRDKFASLLWHDPAMTRPESVGDAE